MKVVVGKSKQEIPPEKPGTDFYHAGEMGDLIYGLYTMRALGGGSLLTGPVCADNRVSQPRGIAPAHFKFMRSFLEAQPYVSQVGWTQFPPLNAKYDLNKFREFWFKDGELKKKLATLGAKKPYSLCWMHCAAFDIKLDERDPWLSVPEKKHVAPVIFARSSRFNNKDFPWLKIQRDYGEDAAFIGTEEEHKAFVDQFGPVDFYKVQSMLEMAQVIDGAMMFVGNQSAPMALALGLGFGNERKLIQEVNIGQWSEGHDCRFERPKAVYCWDGMI